MTAGTPSFLNLLATSGGSERRTGSLKKKEVPLASLTGICERAAAGGKQGQTRRHGQLNVVVVLTSLFMKSLIEDMRCLPSMHVYLTWPPSRFSESKMGGT